MTVLPFLLDSGNVLQTFSKRKLIISSRPKNGSFKKADGGSAECDGRQLCMRKIVRSMMMKMMMIKSCGDSEFYMTHPELFICFKTICTYMDGHLL